MIHPDLQKPVLVTGGAGFIGSWLVDRLLEDGCPEVRVFDDFSSGRREFLSHALSHPAFRLIEGDLRQPDLQQLRPALRGVSQVFHLAANPDARRGIADPRIDFNLEILATFHVLEAMRLENVKRVMLASSGTVYGETPVMPLPEDYGPLLPISIYGAGKLASEGLVSAYAGTFGFQAWIYRFGNVVGPRTTHGVLKDLGDMLVHHPRELPVMGDGSQKKPYLHVSDVVDGIVYGIQHSQERMTVLNLAVAGATSVRSIAEMLVEQFGLTGKTRICYQGGDRGWPGDVPQSRLCVDKMTALGWQVRYSSDEAVKRAIAEVHQELMRAARGAEVRS